MALDVYTPQGCFSSTFPRFRIGNAYARPINHPQCSVSAEIAFFDCDFPYLVGGDFNIHNPAVDPFRILSSNEERESAPFFDLAADLGFSHLNTLGTYTRFPFSGSHRSSAIALAFANPHMFPAFCLWDVTSLSSTGSDHVPILISLQPPSPVPSQSRPRWEDTDWSSLTETLRNWQIPPPPRTPSPKQLDLWFSSTLSTLTSTIEASTPRSPPFLRSKPWWTPLLTALGKEFNKTTQRAKKL